jgi:hypothetical protein
MERIDKLSRSSKFMNNIANSMGPERVGVNVSHYCAGGRSVVGGFDLSPISELGVRP